MMMMMKIYDNMSVYAQSINKTRVINLHNSFPILEYCIILFIAVKWGIILNISNKIQISKRHL